jgi:hypothetical protein
MAFKLTTAWIAFLLGGALVFFAPRLALLPRAVRGQYGSRPMFRRAAESFGGFFLTDAGVLSLKIIWYVCGILWLLNGIGGLVGLAKP